MAEGAPIRAVDRVRGCLFLWAAAPAREGLERGLLGRAGGLEGRGTR